MDKESSNLWKLLTIVGSAVVIIFLTVLVTLFVLQSSRKPISCEPTTFGKPLELAKDPAWDAVQRYEIPSKDIVVSRTADRCYLIPMGKPEKEGTGRPLKLIQDPLSLDQTEALATHIALEICQDVPVYMTAEIIPEFEEQKQERKRRQAPAVPAVRKPNLPTFDEAKNDNRCDEVLIDCTSTVGRESACHTGVNGIFWMERKCTDDTTIVVEMTKPPGRLLKIIQQNWRLCLQRRKQGKRC